MAGRQRTFVVLGLALLLLTLWSAEFRDHEGLIEPSAVVPLAAAFGLLVLGIVPRDLSRTAGWLLMSLLGAAAATQLAVAGPPVRYQHYLAWRDLWTQPIPAAIVFGQMFVVAVVGIRSLGPWLGRALRAWGAWRTIALLMLLVAAGATVSREIPRYAGEVILAVAIRLTQMVNVALIVAAIPTERRARLGEWIARRFGPPSDQDVVSAPSPRLAWGLAIFTTVFAAFLSSAVYGRHPHVPDEYHYIWQARYFAQGFLSLPLPPAPRAFDIYLTDFGARGWYSVVPPGWPAVLALGALIGLTSLVNPVLAGINVLLADRILARLLDRRTARLALVIFALTPWHYLLAMTYMAQTVSLTLFLVAMWAVGRARETGLVRWGWIGGAALGYLATVRQLDAAIAAVFLGLWAIGVGGRRIRVGATAGLVLGAIAVAALILPYNRYFTGKPSVFPIMAYNDQRFGPGANDYGFGSNRGMGWELDPNPGHGPVDGLINTNLNLSATEIDLFGWATGSLVLVGFALLAGRWGSTDRLMVGLIGLTWTAYFLNYFSGGPDFGARYWFLMVIPLVVLTARGLTRLSSFLADVAGPGHPRGQSDAVAFAALGVLMLGSLVVYLPWRSVDKYRHFRGMRPDIRSLAKRVDFGRSVVLINGNEVPDFASAAVYNPILLTADQPIFAWNRDSAVAGELKAAFPDRPTWVVDGPTVTGSGYRVRQSPPHDTKTK